MKKYNTAWFIKNAKLVHGSKYDYSKTVYVAARENLNIVCPDHGRYLKNASKHLSGQGCPKCSSTKSDATRIKMSLAHKKKISDGYVPHTFTKKERKKSQATIRSLPQSAIQERADKAGLTMKGRPQNMAGLTGAKTENIHAKEWDFVNKAKGLRLTGRNLNQLVRDNPDYFDKKHLNWRGSTCNAVASLRALKPSKNKNRRIKYSWLGWRLASRPIQSSGD